MKPILPVAIPAFGLGAVAGPFAVQASSEAQAARARALDLFDPQQPAIWDAQETRPRWSD